MKQSVETIASIVEGLLRANKSIIPTRPNRLSFLKFDTNRVDMPYFINVATLLVNDSIKNGFCELASLKPSFTRSSPMPNESFEIERFNFKLACLIYYRENQCHLILFKK